jgi:hypothetical protein
MLERALTAAGRLHDWDKAEVLESLAARLPEELLERALTTAGSIPGNSWRKAKVLGSLAERMPEPHRTEVLEWALTVAEGTGGIGMDFSKAAALGSLAAHLPKKLLERALTAAEGIEDDGAKAVALGSLAERLPEPRRTKLLERALTAAEGIGDEGNKVQALGSLAARLPEPRLSSFLVRVPNHLSTMTRTAGFDLLNKLATIISFPSQEIPLSIAETILDIGDRWK